MARVWIEARHTLPREALAALVTELGFTVSTTPDEADLAVVDLTLAAPPYPAAAVPSVAIGLRADALGPGPLELLGYREVLGPDAGRAELAAALTRVVHGLRDDAASVRGTPLGTFGTAAAAGDGLTPREREVHALVTIGLPNKRIAVRLGITERTVKHHVSAIMRKHGVRSRMRLIVNHHDVRNGRPTVLRNDIRPMAFADVDRDRPPVP